MGKFLRCWAQTPNDRLRGHETYLDIFARAGGSLHFQSTGVQPRDISLETIMFDFGGRKKRADRQLIAEHEKRETERKILEAQLRHVAAENDLVLLKQLIKMGVDVNAQDPETGRTALMMAVNYGHHSAIVFLLSHQSDVYINAHNGRSAVDIAHTKGQPDVAALLEDVHRANEEYRKPKPDAF